AAIALVFIGTDRAREILLHLFQEKRTPFLLWCVVEGLAQIKHDSVFQLAERLYKHSSVKRIYALYLLGTSGVMGEPHYKAAIKILQGALNHTDLNVRGYAGRAISYLRIAYSPFQRLLEEHLRDAAYNPEEQWVQRRYIEALGHVGTPDVIPTLELYLRSIERRTRQRTREAIAEIKRRHQLI
ncbi:MAG: hypothetical protein AAF629_15850, partial [Chloroflexota bacterium]